jgi:hypothetical protein
MDMAAVTDMGTGTATTAGADVGTVIVQAMAAVITAAGIIAIRGEVVGEAEDIAAEAGAVEIGTGAAVATVDSARAADIEAAASGVVVEIMAVADPMVEADPGAAGAETTVVVGITVADHGVVVVEITVATVADRGVAAETTAVVDTAEEATMVAVITEGATSELLVVPSCPLWLAA